MVEECGQNHMTRRLDKAQQQLEITLEHMEITLETVQNHQVNMHNNVIFNTLFVYVYRRSFLFGQYISLCFSMVYLAYKNDGLNMTIIINNYVFI